MHTLFRIWDLAHRWSTLAIIPSLLISSLFSPGYGDLEPFSVNTGNKRLETPNVLRFAQEGMRFTQAYAGAPVCGITHPCMLIHIHYPYAHIKRLVPSPSFFAIFFDPSFINAQLFFLSHSFTLIHTLNHFLSTLLISSFALLPDDWQAQWSLHCEGEWPHTESPWYNSRGDVAAGRLCNCLVWCAYVQRRAKKSKERCGYI